MIALSIFFISQVMSGGGDWLMLAGCTYTPFQYQHKPKYLPLSLFVNAIEALFLSLPLLFHFYTDQHGLAHSYTY